MLSGGLFDQRVSYSLCPSALGKVDLQARRGWNQNFPLTLILILIYFGTKVIPWWRVERFQLLVCAGI
jgi:hypothetical protein